MGNCVFGSRMHPSLKNQLIGPPRLPLVTRADPALSSPSPYPLCAWFSSLSLSLSHLQEIASGLQEANVLMLLCYFPPSIQKDLNKPKRSCLLFLSKRWGHKI